MVRSAWKLRAGRAFDKSSCKVRLVVYCDSLKLHLLLFYTQASMITFTTLLWQRRPVITWRYSHSVLSFIYCSLFLPFAHKPTRGLSLTAVWSTVRSLQSNNRVFLQNSQFTFCIQSEARQMTTPDSVWQQRLTSTATNLIIGNS